MNTRTIKCLFLSVALILTGGAHAAEIDEIVVTATKRDANIRDVPFSINAQTAEDIERTGADSLEDLSRSVAGLTIQNLGPGQSQVAIRGVSAGQIVRDQPGVKEQVGIYLDESVISLSLFTPDFDLYDLNRVETLRGPQGTLFGSGSVGGTIRYITNQPDSSGFDANLSLSGNAVADGANGASAKGMINVPIDDLGAVRVVAYSTSYAGFIDALGENGAVVEDINNGRRDGVRLAASIQWDENIHVTPRAIYQKINFQGFNRQETYNVFANEFTTVRTPISLGEREQHLLVAENFQDETALFDLTVDVDLGDMALTTVTSFSNRNILVSRDASALTGSVSLDLGFQWNQVVTPSNLRDTTDLEQVTQEIRLASTTDDDLQWVAGFFWADTERKYSQRLPTPGYDAATDANLGADTADGAANGFPADSPYAADLPYDIEQVALFGEVNYAINDQLDVTVGGRWYDFEEVRSFTSGGIFANGDNQTDMTASDGFSPRVMLSYDVNDEVTVNGQISQGFRLGGVNDPLNSTLCSAEDEAIFGNFQSYSDETMTNYEIGVKTAFDLFTFNGALFLADIQDLQATLDAGSCSSRISFNVPEAESSGVELELNAQPMEGLTVTAAASFVNTEFKSTVVDGGGAVIGGLRSGNRLASVPENQFAVSAEYEMPMNLFGTDGQLYLTGSYQHVGDRITQPSDQEAGAGDFSLSVPFAGATGDEVTSLNLILDDYQLLNLAVGFDTGDYTVELFVNNATDENALLSFDRERGGRARLAHRIGTPRMIGWRFNMNF